MVAPDDSCVDAPGGTVDPSAMPRARDVAFFLKSRVTCPADSFWIAGFSPCCAITTY